MKRTHLKKLEKFRESLSAMRDELDDMAGEYRDKFDNASERWQSSDAGSECDTWCDTLEVIAADVEKAESSLAELCS